MFKKLVNVKEKDLKATKKKILSIFKEKETFNKIKNMILPEIFLTGTSLDIDDPIMKEQEEEKKKIKTQMNLVSMREIFNKELLPSLLQSFSLNNNDELQKAIVDVIIRLYNQREEFLDHACNTLLLFDKTNIMVFKIV